MMPLGGIEYCHIMAIAVLVSYYIIGTLLVKITDEMLKSRSTSVKYWKLVSIGSCACYF
jgi:hypothetical protein